MLSAIFYEFKIFTSDILNAGTDANVFAMLTGAKGSQTTEVHLKGSFRQGGQEVLYVNLEDVGEPLRSLHIRHDNSGSNPAWHLDHVEVRPMGSKPPAVRIYRTSHIYIYIYVINAFLIKLNHQRASAFT